MIVFRSRIVAALAALAIAMPATMNTAGANDVTVYSQRSEEVMGPMLARFTEATGIRARLIHEPGERFVERLIEEGEDTPVDLLIATDALTLQRAREAGILRPLQSDVLNTLIPSQHRDPFGYWYALSLRTQPVAYAKERVDGEPPAGYRSLADERWQGRLCVHGGSHDQIRSLVAFLIRQDGEEAAEAWAQGLVNNLNADYGGGVVDAPLTALAEGQCDVAIVDSESYVRMRKDDIPGSGELALSYPAQNGEAVYANISGAGVAAASDNVAGAERLIEYLVSDEGQELYVEQAYEHAVRPDIPVHPDLRPLGQLHGASAINPVELVPHLRAAEETLERVGWPSVPVHNGDHGR